MPPTFSRKPFCCRRSTSVKGSTSTPSLKSSAIVRKINLCAVREKYSSLINSRPLLTMLESIIIADNTPASAFTSAGRARSEIWVISLGIVSFFAISSLFKFFPESFSYDWWNKVFQFTT